MCKSLRAGRFRNVIDWEPSKALASCRFPLQSHAIDLSVLTRLVSKQQYLLRLGTRVSDADGAGHSVTRPLQAQHIYSLGALGQLKTS